jgi:hypothetical protein
MELSFSSFPMLLTITWRTGKKSGGI